MTRRAVEAGEELTVDYGTLTVVPWEMACRCGTASCRGVVTDADVRDAIARGERYDGIVLGDDRNLRLVPPDWPGIHGNHSCDPNLWLADEVTLVTRRPVAAGEELTVDYATMTVVSWEMECRCGAAICRGVVTGDDWRRPDLRQRYGGHFSPFIAARIGVA